MLQLSHRRRGALLMLYCGLLFTVLTCTHAAKSNQLFRPVRILRTSWSNCGSVTDPIQLVTLTVTPDTMHLPGDINVNAEVNVGTNLTSPIKGELEVKKKSFLGWIPIPCLDGFGSCDYDDLCSLSPYHNTCPPVYVQEKLPCNCPINMGTYKAVSLPITISGQIPHWLEKGHYKAEVKFSENGNPLGCYELETILD